MDDKINEREQEHHVTTDQRDAHLLVSVSEAPNGMENFNITLTSTSRMGALVVNSPSGLVIAGDPESNGSSKSLANQQRDRRETSEEADLGRASYIKDKDDMEGVSAVPKPSGMDMAGTPGVSPSRDARLLEVKDDAYLGILAR
eukprot:4765383-Pleurochrysis_carterae.AAC.1